MGILKTRESMVRNLNNWDKETFSDSISRLTVNKYNAEAIALLHTVVTAQRLWDKKMNGFCTEGLKKTEKEGLKICYVDVFNKMEDTDQYWDPALLIYELCQMAIDEKELYTKTAIENNMSFEELVIGMSGRLLRALPSYIREEQLKNSLGDAFKTASFEKDANLDKKKHCDIKMILNGNTYYIWSFLSTQRSIVNFAEKFNGTRGKVPNGYHLLCPFDRNGPRATVYKGWCFYAKEHTDDVIAAVYQNAAIDYNESINDRLIYSQRFFSKPVVIKKAC